MGPGRGLRRTLPGRRHDDPGTGGQPLDESKPVERKKKKKKIFIIIRDTIKKATLILTVSFQFALLSKTFNKIKLKEWYFY